MNNILIISQDRKFTVFAKSYGIGRREPKQIIGDELKTLMEKKGIDSEQLISELGNSYRKNVERILSNEEIPSSKMLEKITSVLNIASDYFEDKELENVIVTDNGIIIAKYENNAKAIEIKNKIDEMVLELYRSGKPIIIEMPKE